VLKAGSGYQVVTKPFFPTLRMISRKPVLTIGEDILQ
jgi:hypothetical protein